MGQPADDAVTVLLPAGDPAAALAEARALLDRGTPVVLDVRAATCPRVELVGALARLRLHARRRDARLALQAPEPVLRHVAELLGLCEVLGLPGLGEEPQRQAQAREDLAAEVLEEVVHVPDAPA